MKKKNGGRKTLIEQIAYFLGLYTVDGKKEANNIKEIKNKFKR